MGDSKHMSMKFSVAVLCISIGFVQGTTIDSVVTLGPTNGMCVGVNIEPKTFSEKTEIYVANCKGPFKIGRKGSESFDPAVGFLKMEMAGIAFIGDGYLKKPSKCAADKVTECTAENNIYVMGGPSDTSRTWQKQETQKNFKSDANQYAFSSTGAYFTQSAACSNKIATSYLDKSPQEGGGKYTEADYAKANPDCPKPVNGFYAGTATYMVTKGEVSLNMNEFDVASSLKSACISPIADGKCGAERTFKKGTFKFSLFGYSLSDSDTEKSKKTLEKVVKKTAKGATKPFQYIGFRQLLQLQEMPASATFTAMVTKVAGGAPVDPAQAVEDDINKLKLCVGSDKCLEYSFPTQYNSGELNKGSAVPTDAKSKTFTIKIRASWKDKAKRQLYIDYLMSATELMGDKKWFVYDPDVIDPSALASTPDKDAKKELESVSISQKVTFKKIAKKADYTTDVMEQYNIGFALAYSLKGFTVGETKKKLVVVTGGKQVLDADVTVTSAAARRSVDVTFALKFKGATSKTTPTNTELAAAIKTVITANGKGGTAPEAADVTVAKPVDKAAKAATPKANGTSSASCTGQFSLAALSIPVVAMVISKM